MSTVPGTLSVLVLAAVVGAVALFLRTGQGLRAPGPRLSPDLPAALLTRAGFPVTRHNVLAVTEWLADRFLAELDGRPAAPGTAALDSGLRQVAGTDDRGRAQRVLDAIAEVDPAAAVRLVSRAPAELLATAGTGQGLLGGSVFEPLPVAPAVADTHIPTPRSVPASSARPAPAGPGLRTITVAPVV